MSAANTLDRAVTILLGVAVVLTIGRLSCAQTPSRNEGAASLVKENAFKEVRAVALPRQATAGVVQLIEFIDLECPYCASYQAVLDSVKAIVRGDVELSYINMPIHGHRLARPGAAAVECAADRGAVESFVGAVYANADSVGYWSWARYAEYAGIRDTTNFSACVLDPEVLARVDASKTMAERLKVRGTPTVWVEGWRFDSPPSTKQLIDAIHRLSPSSSRLP